MITVALAIFTLFNHTESVSLGMFLDTEHKISETSHPKLINFNYKLSLLIFFNFLCKIKHVNFKVLDKIDMTVQVPKVIKVFSKGR